ncbi:DUF4242 domain-containing protein [Parageobacillus thermoglucosidasius]|uniref:DUF4242 domain-containing protein n=3 Tax=Anoxybacillaceae TaxID=3120669 RepID=A0AB38R4U4_PARTM|nr:DUF4242 domain-containing protein [Parageobacillus thermoglucosidasius]KYD15875.1 hypothetical protein B4168_4102 [Anoxybacillus flavithermus]REK59964.1 MAG: DUF4242 domain-containing protein [Geobacillus sp.]ALF10443.1 hypothetical protein AOT13_10685 [Parageobacillus thermoglucosidasius]ANZ30524.1 hypothetical protein BCV53_10700 [Parageobacillus thermoglucosidasius]APM81262.1 hypothetical protein BCV54_10710 [Parageobacillus thermoglucosidasius]
MALYLVESILTGAVKDKEVFEKKVSEIREELSKNGANLIEVQVSKDFSRAFFIFESEGRNIINDRLRRLGIPVTLIKPVRLVGKDIEEVKKEADTVNYVVEWNLPENLTMEEYLDRKKKNSVHYAEVPEVTFSRTYVCEDMTKCLCFYHAPDEQAVKKAREAVKAPIDTVTEILPNK